MPETRAALRPTTLEHHPLVQPAGEITFFVAGLQDAAVLHHDAEPAGKAQTAEQLLHGGGEQIGFPDFVAEFGKDLVFAGWFRVVHGSHTSPSTTEPRRQ